MWKAVFKLTTEEALTLDEWVGRRLRKPCTHHMGHAGRIIIDGPTRDDVFKTSEWVRNQNPLGRKLNYSVIGYEGTTIIFLSYCRRCRSGESHDEHSGAIQKGEGEAQAGANP